MILDASPQKNDLHSSKLVAMENGPFEDVFPIENGDFPWLCLFTRG